MLSQQAELVWQGRIHLGDEAGVFGDASYSGLSVELPVTLEKTNPNGPDTTTLVIETEKLETFPGYPGHRISVIAFEEDPTQPGHFTSTVIETALMTSGDSDRKEIILDLSGRPTPALVSVRFRVDTEVPTGLYNDFVFIRLSNKSQDFTFVASLGFHA